MSKIKKGRRSNEFKFKVALEAIKEDKTLAELGDLHGVHSSQVGEWKRQLLERGGEIFSNKVSAFESESQKEREHLVSSIGLQQIKIDFLKKKLGISDMATGLR